MGTEAVRVGQILYCLKAQRCTPLTDSVLYKPANRAKVCLPELTFDDLHALHDRF